MNRIICSMIFACGVFLTSAAFSTTVATLDMQKIFKNSKQVEEINKSMEKKFGAQRDQLVAFGKDLQKQKEKLSKESATLKSSEIQKMRKDIQEKEESFSEKQSKFQQKVFAAQNDAMHKFTTNLQKSASKYAKKNDIDIIIPDSNAIYVSSKLDITDEMLNALSSAE